MLQVTPVQPATQTQNHALPLNCSLSPPGNVHVGGTHAATCARSCKRSASSNRVAFNRMPPRATMPLLATMRPLPALNARSPLNADLRTTLPFPAVNTGKAEDRVASPIRRSVEQHSAAERHMKYRKLARRGNPVGKNSEGLRSGKQRESCRGTRAGCHASSKRSTGCTGGAGEQQRKSHLPS
jgi:hypothetical protein